MSNFIIFAIHSFSLSAPPRSARSPAGRRCPSVVWACAHRTSHGRWRRPSRACRGRSPTEWMRRSLSLALPPHLSKRTLITWDGILKSILTQPTYESAVQPLANGCVDVLNRDISKISSHIISSLRRHQYTISSYKLAVRICPTISNNWLLQSKNSSNM